MAQRNRQGRLATSLALVGTLAGVLIWQKLRLSTNMPRAAYAIPRDEADAKRTPPERALIIDETTSTAGEAEGIEPAESTVIEAARPAPEARDSDAAEEPAHDS